MKLVKKLPMKVEKTGKKQSYGVFLCLECAMEFERRLSDGKKAKSCGNHKHGETNTRLYSIWVSMKQRCSNTKHIAYKNYGGRGITICPEWVNDYIKFRDWSLNNGYKEGLTIDRINNNGNYEPSNCQWITRIKNIIKRSNIKLSLAKANEIRDLHTTGNYTQKKLSMIYNIDYSMIWKIINNKSWENKRYE